MFDYKATLVKVRDGMKAGEIHRSKICVFCKSEYKSKYSTSIYCSRLCSCRHRSIKKSARTRLAWNRFCVKCGSSFVSRSKKTRHCSISCAALKLAQIECKICGESFKPLSSRTIFCSMSCRDKGKSYQKSCLICNKTFKVKKSVVNREGMAGKFCSAKCYSDYQVGETNPNWRGGGSYFRGERWMKIRLEVRKRDNYTCQNCGKPETKRKHDVHHVVPYRITQDNSLQNLISLCMPCHRIETSKERRLYK